MSSNRRRLGALGENAAYRALSDRGYEIVERNWRCPGGEIDAVARDGDTWVFVEVKTRRHPGPEAALDTARPAKLARIRLLAQRYLSEHALEEVSWRIDWVAIEVDARRQVGALAVIQGIGADV